MTNKLSRMQNLIKAPIFFFLLMSAICNVSAQQEEPKPGTYFDLRINRGADNKVQFQMGKDGGGYLRNPNNRDTRYVIFTSKQLIRVSELYDTSSSNISSVIQFDSLVLDGVYQKGGPSSKLINKQRPKGYFVVDKIDDKNGWCIISFQDDNSKSQFQLFITKEEDSWNNEVKMTISKLDKNPQDTTIIINQDTIYSTRKYIVGDTINLELTRERRAMIDSISINNKRLSGKYILINDIEKRNNDDMLYTKASLITNAIVLPETKEYKWIIKACISYLKDGSLENEVRYVVIPMKTDDECDKYAMIFWSIIGIGFFAASFSYWIIKMKKRKKEKEEEEKKKKEKAAQDNAHLPNEQSGGENQMTDQATIPSSDSNQHFEQLTNADAAKLLKEYLIDIYNENITKKELSKLKEKINKSWITKCCREWNEHYPEDKILDSEFTIDNLFLQIEKGYVGYSVKETLENKLRKHGSPQDSYFELLTKYKTFQYIKGFTEGNQAYQETTCEKLKNILSALKEQHFAIEGTETNSTDGIIEKILSIIRKGVLQNTLQNIIDQQKNTITNLEETLQSANKDKEGQQTLYELERQSRKKEQKEFETKDKTHQDKIIELNKEYNDAITELKKTHKTEKKELNNKITDLNSTIEKKNEKITEIETSSQDDCHYFISTFCKQIEKINATMEQLAQSTSIMGGNDSKCANIIKKAQDSFIKFNKQVEQSNNEEHWQRNTVKLPEVIADLQNFIEMGLRSTGWVNIVSYLYLYAGTTAALNDSFNTNGLSTYKLTSLFYDVVKLISLCGVKIMLPNLLVEKYNDEYYVYENADQWIQTFSPELKPRDYAAKIFDMGRIGYQIDGKEEVKAKVYSL